MMTKTARERVHARLDAVLDADAPDTYADALASLLGEFAEECYGAAIDVREAWQEKALGDPWARLAKLCERTGTNAKKAAQ